MNMLADPGDALACIATLAGRGFDTPESASALILPALAQYLHCQASVLTRITADARQVNVNAAHQCASGDDIVTAGSVFVPPAAERAFWQGAQVMDGAMPITVPVVGYAVSAPICLADGTCWGLLVGLATAPPEWTPQHAFVMNLLARRLADEITRHQQREHMTTMKGDFVSIVSHEFRTALMSILGFSQMLRDEPCSRDEVHEFAADIYSDATRISRMITDMLDLDRMESGSIKLAMAEVDLNHLLRDITARFTATATNHTLRLQLDAALTGVVADSDKIIQIVTNLLSNAIKYSPQGGEVVVGSAVDGDVAHLWVRDQGMGVPNDALERIFERYARIEARTSRYIQGTGLGLPIVRQLAQMHGGDAWAESIPGKGATFHVTLPLAPSLARAA